MTEKRQWLPGVRVGEGCDNKGVVQGVWGDETVLYPDYGVSIQTYTCVTTLRTVYHPQKSILLYVNVC